jgi:sec-independent protein translocase protein TatB
MFGRLQRYVNEVKADINREMELDELRKLRSEVQSAASEFESSIHKAAQEVDSGVRAVETEMNEAGKPPADTAPAAAPDSVAPAASPGVPAPKGEDTPRQTALPGFDRI